MWNARLKGGTRPKPLRSSDLPEWEKRIVDQEQKIPLIEEVRQKVSALDRRDIQLWAINALVILVVAAGLAALILPHAMWNLKAFRLEGWYLRELFFGFIALIILFNLYVLEQRRLLRDTRQELFRALARSQAAENLSQLDPLTEIFSRRYLNQALSREVNRADRQGSSLTFLLVDVDGFKSVNKRYGQLVGDSLLNSVGQLLLATFRRSDTIIRYGGDEFLVLLSETDEQQAERAVERLLVKVEHWNRETSLPGYRLSLSCGLATYAKGASPSKLLDVADQRMNLQRTTRSSAH